ncbi:MAG: radical SAM protein [Clostridia bacterium]|jgi:uncharacterized protein
MRLSRFNIWVKDHPREGDYLLFNSRTQALLKIDKGFRDDLYASAVSGILKPRIEENINALKSNGIIASDKEEEDAKLDDFFGQLKYECGGLAFEATILTTYSCNFRCVYCFEESVKERVFLDKETSSLIVEWLIKRVRKKGLKSVFLVFYGGEPLLNPGPIYDISQRMREWADKEGISFAFSIITNGSLMGSALADKLAPLGLKEVRVTIDGDRETHNSKRPYMDGSGTFDKIISNIKSIIHKVNIGVVGNFDRESFPGVLRLLDYLEEEGLLHRLSSIGFAPIVPRLGPKDNPKAIELSECSSFIGENGLFNETIMLKKELMRRGVKVKSDLAINACPLFMQDAGVTIDPKGIIYKCNSFLGYPEFSVGDVREEEFNSNHGKFLNIDAWNRCPQDCPYIPMCQGGCRFFSYVENNDLYGLACKRGYLDRIVPELIKLEYELLLKKG